MGPRVCPQSELAGPVTVESEEYPGAHRASRGPLSSEFREAARQPHQFHGPAHRAVTISLCIIGFGTHNSVRSARNYLGVLAGSPFAWTELYHGLAFARSRTAQ